MPLSLHQITSVLGPSTVVSGDQAVIVDKMTSPESADDQSIVWLGEGVTNPAALVAECRARVFIVPSSMNLAPPPNKAVVAVPDPRLAAITILSRFFRKRPAWGKHPSAVIHPEAQIAPDSFIGPNSYVGRCTIGNGSILYGNNYLYDGVTIGQDVTVHAGTVIGTDGFGYHESGADGWTKFEHVGGVVIGNGVEIGANTCIDRGTLGNTVINEGTKIDNLVHIAHNVVVGKHCLIIAHAMVGGSCIIGDHAWIAPNAAILQKMAIGEHAVVGLGAVVIQPVPPRETWAGVPARKLGERAGRIF